MGNELDLSLIMRPAIQEYFYFKWILTKRLEKYGDLKESLHIPISSVLKQSTLNMTVVDLVAHGLQPLVANLQKLPSSEISLNYPFNMIRNMGVEDILRLYHKIITDCEIILGSLQLSSIDSSLTGKDPDEIADLLGKVIGHLIHHTGQAISYHTHICDILSKS